MAYRTQDIDQSKRHWRVLQKWFGRNALSLLFHFTLVLLGGAAYETFGACK